MQHLEVSGAVQHIYVVLQLRVNKVSAVNICQVNIMIAYFMSTFCSMKPEYFVIIRHCFCMRNALPNHFWQGGFFCSLSTFSK